MLAHQNDRKLISTEARHYVRGTNAFAQSLADSNEQFVADFVTISIVDQFESIKIDKQQRCLKAVLLYFSDDFFHR